MSTFPQVIIHWSLFQWWRRKPMFYPCDAKVSSISPATNAQYTRVCNE
jgi:hypothetical protein